MAHFGEVFKSWEEDLLRRVAEEQRKAFDDIRAEQAALRDEQHKQFKEMLDQELRTLRQELLDVADTVRVDPQEAVQTPATPVAKPQAMPKPAKPAVPTELQPPRRPTSPSVPAWQVGRTLEGVPTLRMTPPGDIGALAARRSAVPSVLLQPEAGDESSQPRPKWWHRRILRSFFATLALLVFMLLVAAVKYPISTLINVFFCLLYLIFYSSEERTIQDVEAKMRKEVKLLRFVQSLRASLKTEQRMEALLHGSYITAAMFNPELGILGWVFVWDADINFVLMIVAGTFTLFTRLSWSVVLTMHEQKLSRGRSRHILALPSTGNQAVETSFQQMVFCLQGNGRDPPDDDHGKIFQILAECGDEELNELLERMQQSPNCSLERVFLHFPESIDSPSRADLIDLLCFHRSHVLTVRSKSVLLHTLMATAFKSPERVEVGIESLLLSTEGDELSELKCLQDAFGDIHSMHKLMWQDVTSEHSRNRVLGHFLAEATTQVAHRTLWQSSHFRTLMRQAQSHGCCPKDLKFPYEAKQPPNEDGDPPAEADNRPVPVYHGQGGSMWIKVVTDMDDTLECSGGKWPAGIDKRYPRHTLYPGVGAFYEELQGAGCVGRLVALSARPHIVGEVVESRIFKKFRQILEDERLPSMPALLTGSVETGGQFLLSGGDEDGLRALAQKKCENFQQFVAMYPEFRFVFVGDNGQADYAVAEFMNRTYPHIMEQVFIHEVQPIQQTWGYEEPVPDDSPADTSVIFFWDYVDAATKAVLRPKPLISPEGLLRVMKAVVEDFGVIDGWKNAGRREAEAYRVNKSLQKAGEVLKQRGMNIQVQYIDGTEPGVFPVYVSVATKESRGWLLSALFSKKAPVISISTGGAVGENAWETGIQTDAEDAPQPATSSTAVAPEAMSISMFSRAKAILNPVFFSRGAATVTSRLPDGSQQNAEQPSTEPTQAAEITEPRTTTTTAAESAPLSFAARVQRVFAGRRRSWSGESAAATPNPTPEGSPVSRPFEIEGEEVPALEEEPILPEAESPQLPPPRRRWWGGRGEEVPALEAESPPLEAESPPLETESPPLEAESPPLEEETPRIPPPRRRWWGGRSE